MLAGFAPEIAARTDEIGDTDAPSFFLSLAAARLTSSTWGNVYQQAVVLLAAHMATLAPATAAASLASATVAGPVTAKSTQDRSESYGSATAGVSGMTLGDAALARTKYGLEFLQLRSTRYVRSPLFVTSTVLTTDETTEQEDEDDE